MKTKPKIPWVILNIPHSSKKIPDELKDSLLLNDEELEMELIRMTDSYVDELFSMNHENVQTFVFPISRLIVDPERFVDDSKESMSLAGMGVVYTKTSHGENLRKPVTKKEKQSLLQKYYHPYFQKITITVKESLKNNGFCLIIDCHSFSSKPLPYEPDQTPNRPHICIGTDDFHTPLWLSEITHALFKKHYKHVEINRPYSGSFVPLDFYNINKNVCSIMIEINRSLYMDEKTGDINQKFYKMKTTLQHIITDLIKETTDKMEI